MEVITSLDRQEGYVLSKWLAEYMVRQQLISDNHPIAVVRPGMITGHSESGACNHFQFVSRYLRGIIELGYSIDTDGVMTDMNPVDYVSKAIVQIMNSVETEHKILNAKFQIHNSVYNLADLKWATYNEASSACNLVGAPGGICKLPYKEWRAKVVSEDKNAHLYPLLPYFPAQKYFSTNKKIREISPKEEILFTYKEKLNNFSVVDLLQKQIMHMQITF